MKYFLMNKDVEVFEVDYECGYFTSATFDIKNMEVAPLLFFNEEENHLNLLNKWFQHRLSPQSRSSVGRQKAIENCCVSMTDPYWFKPYSSDLTWETVSPHKNDFRSNGYNPDYCTNGHQIKEWHIQENERYLYKYAYTGARQEPDNEYVASAIMDVLKIPHVHYDAVYPAKKVPYSVCKCFTSEEIEFVPAWYLYKRESDYDSRYKILLKAIDKWEIPTTEADINNMVLIDSLIANKNRHWGNFGFVRNNTIGKFLGLAPLFDESESLWHETPQSMILYSEILPHKPFRSDYHYDIHWVKKITADLTKLDKNALESIFEKTHIEPVRSQTIIQAILRNLELIKKAYDA